ncbi:MAG TPA: ABC transporter permease [Opitutaceae bacterium]|nr:ABC transporter permease [Opitutaceae bacterium]
MHRPRQLRLVSIAFISLRALRRNLLRSTLTALGIIIGVGAVITTVSLGSGAKQQVEAQIASLGQNIITVFPGTTTTGGMRGGWGSRSTLSEGDVQAIISEVNGAVAVSGEVRDRQQVLANGLNWNTQVTGVGPEYLSIRSWPLGQGEMFSEADVKATAKVAVIGQTIADQLYPNMDPVGETVRIRNLPFKIVGILGKKGFNYFGQDQDDTILIPYTSHMKRISRREFFSSILIQAYDEESMPRVQQEANDLLLQRRGEREPDFIIRNQLEIAQTANEASRTMRLLLLAVAVVSLVVGGIGVMNIMLVSVTERTREIGIRLAIGAHGRDILLQFLAEATLLSLLGGGLGIVFGVGASRFVADNFGWATFISPGAIAAAVGFSAMIGIFFGFYPARKASLLDPIDALRYE